jgi:hypothetical protein
VTQYDSWLLRQQWEYEDQQELNEQEEEEEDDWFNDPNNVMSRFHY